MTFLYFSHFIVWNVLFLKCINKTHNVSVHNVFPKYWGKDTWAIPTLNFGRTAPVPPSKSPPVCTLCEKTGFE